MDDNELKRFRNTWNVVYADGKWRIVHPLWVSRSLVGHRLGGYVKIESGGQATMEKETASGGRNVKSFTQYHIFTNPEHFASRCIPEEEQSKWQLLTYPITFEQWKHAPSYRPEFHKLGLELVSTKDCLLRSRKGVCHIKIALPLENSQKAFFDYDLSMKIVDESIDLSKIGKQMSRYVALLRSGRHMEFCSFEIRFPCKGIFKIMIYATDSNDATYLPGVLSFRLVCEEDNVNFQNALLPLDPGIVGWGPGPVAYEEGFHVPSHSEGKIEVHALEEVQISFQILTVKEIHVQMVHTSKTSEELQQFISYEKRDIKNTNRKDFVIKAKVPDKDEYGIKIDTRVRSESSATNVCNYLLSGSKEKQPV